MFIPKQDIDNIIERVKDKLESVIREFVELDKSGGSLVGECPKCHAARGLKFTPGKGIFRCFNCNAISGNTPQAFVMAYKDWDFPTAIKWLADHIHYDLKEDKPKVKPGKKAKRTRKDTFCSRQLAESGLTREDVTATVFEKDEEKTTTRMATFSPGTLNTQGGIDSAGDDIIIRYYDLKGDPIYYNQKDEKRRATEITKRYFRVRWQYPDEHKDKAGRPGKYRSPYGAPTFIYIPEAIRKFYKAETPIDRLYIQEGEKKAEKACKHGLPSIAISGIQNLGTNGQLPEDLIRIIETCKVKEVCLLLDSDCFDLAREIKLTDSVDRRPRNFFYAVRNYKEYLRSLKNRPLYVEIYFGHVNKNSKGDKGVDDLLANTLKGREGELSADIAHAINEKDKEGEYVTLHKITSITDHKLEEYWHLNNPNKFAERYRDELKHLPEFKIGRHTWRFDDDGTFVSAQLLDSDEQYWEVIRKTDRQGNLTNDYKFNPARCFRFLQNRGFWRFRKMDGDFCFIHVDPPTVKVVTHTDVRDFVTDYTKTAASEDVLNMLYRGGPQFLGPDKLSNLDYHLPIFEKPTRGGHTFYFENSCWEVTERGVSEQDYSKVSHVIWADKRKAFAAKKTPEPLITIRRAGEGGRLGYKVTDTGRKCHFLQFLINTSNFTWQKEQRLTNRRGEDMPELQVSPEELQENTDHLISKLCAIGYLLVSAKDRSVARAVVAMDGKQSEVGVSSGRSGKSLVGLLFQQVLPTVYINGKDRDIQGDGFLWTDIDERTRCVFIDDARTNFDPEFLFANITGDWKVNYKGGGRATFPFQMSPKIYLTTNHALKGEGGSYRDRQWLIAFSDFYNDKHKPVDDFGVQFFDEWDFEQWNLLYNLLASCVQAYLQFGVVQAPGDRLELRRKRQEIGESFLQWADEYFSSPDHLNQAIVRKTMYDALLDNDPAQRKYTGPSAFKKKMLAYCDYRGLMFNPHKYDPATGEPMYFDRQGNPETDDKRGGVEYFTIGNERFASPAETSDSGNKHKLPF